MTEAVQYAEQQPSEQGRRLEEYLESLDPAAPAPPDETRTHNFKAILLKVAEDISSDSALSDEQQ